MLVFMSCHQQQDVALETALHGVFNSDQAPCFRFPAGAGAHECGAQHAVADRPLQHAL